MSKKNKFMIKSITILSILLLIILGLGFSSTPLISLSNGLKEKLALMIEDQWREEGRLKLQYITTIFERAIKNGEVDPWDDLSIHRWMTNYLLDMRNGGDTSDPFAINMGFSVKNITLNEIRDLIKKYDDTKFIHQISETLSSYDVTGKKNKEVYDFLYDTVYQHSSRDLDINPDVLFNDLIKIYFQKEKFIIDGSPDCARKEFIIRGRFLSDEAQLHRVPSYAEKAIVEMRKIYDTDHTSKIIWKFDDADEWLEWKFVPTGLLGFSEEPATVTGYESLFYKKIIIVMGTQSDEILSRYSKIFDALAGVQKHARNTMLLSALLVFVTILINFVSTIKSDSPKKIK